MPAIDQGQKPKKKQPAPVAPRNADTGDRSRARPVVETGKVRMYAHPQRPAAQRVFRQQDAAAAAERRRVAGQQAAADRLRRQASRIHVTPVASPDARDSSRSAGQVAHDRAAVDHAVRTSREKALRERGRGSGTRAVKNLVHYTWDAAYGPQGLQRNGVVNEQEARDLRAKGVRVRTLTASESKDVGATMGVRSIGTGGTALTRMPMAIGVATAQDPKAVLSHTAKGLRDMATGAIPALVKTATDPKGAASSMAHDYGRRYADINKPGGIQKTADRIKKEGAAPELMDGVAIGVPIGKAADAMLGGLARRGALGGAARRVTTSARPALRTTGGAARAQVRARGLTKAALQSRKDRRAAAAVDREVTRADSAARRGAGAAAGEAVDPRRVRGPVDAVVREAHDRGEVVPTRTSVTRPGRRVVSQRQIGKAQRRAAAVEKGRTLHSQRAEQRSELARGAQKVLAGLNPKERRAFKLAMQTGAVTPTAGRDAAVRRISMIERTRKYGGDTLNTDVDELPALNTILKDPVGHFTPRLERAVRTEMERGARVGEGDPALGRTATERAATAEQRRLAPQADTLGITRRGTPVDDAIRAADRTVRDTRRAKNVARKKRDRAAVARGQAEGYARAGAARVKRRIDQRLAREEHVAAQHANVAAQHDARALRARTPHTRAEHVARAVAARARETRALDRVAVLKRQRAAVDIGYRRSVQRARSAEGNAQHELERQLEGLRSAGSSARDLRRQKKGGTSLINAEPVPEFQSRVRAARPRGFEEPGFYPSVRRERTRFSLFTSGGARRVKADRGYTGKQFRAGREDNSLVTYTQGLAKNIKRKHNWDLIGKTIEHHAFPWSRRVDNAGMVHGLKYGEIQDVLAKRGIDPGSVTIMDMDAFDGAAATSSSIHDTVVSASDASRIDAAAKLEPGAGRLVVMPKDIADEILRDTRPSGAFGRGFDVVKGKSARVMLGLSPAWLQFQVGANAIQSLLGTKSLPHEWVYANLKWWRGLSPERKAALEPYVGIGSFHDSIDTPRMGAAANGGLINSYRAFKDHPFWHSPRKPLRGASVSQLNPLDTLFRLDNAQNNFFRRAVLYNKLKREAYDRMGTSMVDHQRIADKLLGGWGTGKDAHAMMDTLVHDKAAVEKGAEAIRDFLGDYMTYTSKERRVLSRNIMFYGYLRWSLRFTFYTMPIHHPVMTAIIGQLGGMNAREVRDLLGGDELPWSLGKMYFTKNGKLQSIDLSRANPFLNAVTQAKIPEKGAIRGALLSAIGFLPPVYGALLDVAFGKSAFRDRSLKVDGESTARPNKQGQAMTDSQALGVFAKEMLELAAPIRAIAKVRADGRPQSDNSIPFVHERYTRYKDAQIRADVHRAQADETTGQRILHELAPELPQVNRDPETARKIRRAQGKKSTAAAGAAVALDPATQALIDHYSGGGAASQAVDPDEMQKLIDTYGG